MWHIILFFIPITLSASFFRTIGPSAYSIGHSTIPTDNDIAGSIYSAPAKLSRSKSKNFSTSFFYTKTSLSNIENVVIKNDTNSTSGEAVGNVDLSIDSRFRYQFSLLLPVFSGSSVIGASMITSGTHLAKLDTGDPLLPEYPLKRSQEDRTEFALSFSKKIKNNFSLGLGVSLGFTIEANANTAMSIDSTEHGSLIRSEATIRPDFAPYIQLLYTQKIFDISLLYRKENISKFHAVATGITTSPRIPYQIIIESTPYFDPSEFVFSITYRLKKFTTYLSLTRENWKNYSSPKVEITKVATIEGSDQFSTTQGNIVWNYSLLAEYFFTDHFKIKFGFTRKEDPLRVDLNQSSNTLSSGELNYSLGCTHSFFGKLDHAISISLTNLDTKEVVKTDGQENGEIGRKIGAPGYKVGGSIYTVGTSLSYNF